MLAHRTRIMRVMRPFKLYMNLTFNLTVDLTQSPRNPSSALHLYIISLTITVFGNVLPSLALPLSNEVLGPGSM